MMADILREEWKPRLEKRIHFEKWESISMYEGDFRLLFFKECFAAKDYATILALAAHLPNNVIEEDEQLQMIFDMAEMRAGG